MSKNKPAIKPQKETEMSATLETMVSLKKSTETKGNIVIVRASKLAEAGVTGVVAEGVLEKAEPNKFDNAKTDFFIRGSDNTLYIVNSTQAIQEQLGQEGLIGMKVRVEYNGKKKSKKGSKGYHDFSCFASKTSKA